MGLHPIYHSEDNRLLLDAEGRALIRAAGIGLAGWGAVAFVLAWYHWAEGGAGALVTLLLAGLLLVVGLVTERRPRRRRLLELAGLDAGLLAWWGVQALRQQAAGAGTDPTGPLLAALILATLLVLHRRLRELVLPDRRRSDARLADLVRRCRAALDATGEAVVECADGLHRLVVDGDGFLLVSPSHRRDLVIDRAALAARCDLSARRPLLRLPHPLGEVVLTLNRTNARRLERLLG